MRNSILTPSRVVKTLRLAAKTICSWEEIVAILAARNKITTPTTYRKIIAITITLHCKIAAILVVDKKITTFHRQIIVSIVVLLQRKPITLDRKTFAITAVH